MSIAVAESLLVLRRARGMTQTELADAAGITQAALSRYENDMREPDKEIVRRLADALGVTAPFLAHDFQMRGGIAADAHMRRKATAKPADWKRVEAKVNELRMHSSFLLERVPLEPGRHVLNLDPDEQTPQEAAQMQRASWQMPIGPVRHLVRWLEAAGVLVVEESFGIQRIDGMSQWAGEHAVVLVNAAMPTDRRRWTLAHELGHLILHSTYIGADAEGQANAFAAEFLMPEQVIRSELSNLSLGKLMDLKAEWGTSMQAICERAVELKKATSGDRQRFYRQMRDRGWRIHEPGSDELAPETPTLARSLGRQLLDAGLSRAEVAQMVGVCKGRNSVFLPEPTAGALRRVK